MISVRVLFFANLAEAAGGREHLLVLPEPDLQTLMRQLADTLAPEAIDAITAENVRIARNQSLWDGAGTLTDGDEVAFLPPVTGG